MTEDRLFRTSDGFYVRAAHPQRPDAAFDDASEAHFAEIAARPLCEECGMWARVRNMDAPHHELCSKAGAT